MQTPIRRFVLSLALGAAVFGAGYAVVRAQDAKEIAEKLAAIRDAAADRDLGRLERLVAEFGAGTPGLDAWDEARLLLGKTQLA